MNKWKKQKFITNLIIYGKAMWSWPTAKVKQIFLLLTKTYTRILGMASMKFRNLLLLFILAFNMWNFENILVHINILSILLNVKTDLESYEGSICRLRRILL